MKTTLFFVIVILLVSACKTKPDYNDPTPPVITWTIQNRTNGVETKLSGNASYSANLGDELTITGCAQDDGGVKKLEYYSNSSHTCLFGDIRQSPSPGLISPATIDLGLDKEGNAWKTYCTIINMSLNFECQGDLTYRFGWAQVYLAATNFGNIDEKASLQISVPMPL